MLRLLSVSLLLFLTACNGGEDFSDADLGGPVLQPRPFGDPLNPDVDANEVVFVSGGQEGSGPDTTGVVNNLGYACGEVAAYIPGPADSNDPGDDVGGTTFAELPRNVARCPLDANYVDFFIGQAVGGNSTTRVKLGRYWFPRSSRLGRYIVSPADLIQAPARFGVPDNSAQLFMTVFLQSLDEDPEGNTVDIIDIPAQAHELVANCCTDTDVPPPAPAFDYPSYTDFRNAWQDWFNNTGLDRYSLPNNFQNARARLQRSLDRAMAGTYSAQSLGVSQALILSELGRDGTQPLAFQFPLLVFPDGRLHGMGLMYETDTSDPLQAMLAVKDGASLDRQGNLDSAGSPGVVEAAYLDSVDVTSADLSLEGRIMANIAYYDVSSDTVASDFKSDYPGTDYVLQPGERARYIANAGGRNVSDGLYWMVRTGQVAINWDPQVIKEGLSATDANDNRFYDITLYRACVDNDTCTRQIDNAALEIGPLGNYPEVFDADGSGAADDVWTVTQEIGKQGVTDTGTGSLLRVQLLDSGDVVTDKDGNCSPVDTGTLKDQTGTQEHRVGFVTRTERDSNGNPRSFNMALYLAGDPADRDAIPQFGTEVQGRVDLRNGSATEGAFLRLGEQNFNDGLRAFWTDIYKPWKERQEDPPGDDYARRHLIASLGSGAAEGAPTNSDNCAP